MRGRGFTLAEVLLAGSLSLLLLGLVVSIWLLASSAIRKTYQLQTAQESTLVGVVRLREDFRRSRPQSAVVDGPVLSFLTYEDGSGQAAWDTTGAILWKYWVQYRWEQGRLLRRQTALATPESDLTLGALTPPVWAWDRSVHQIGRELVVCNWKVESELILDVTLQSLYEKQRSDAHLRVMPALYLPD